MEIKDLVGLEKPLKKLIGEVSKAVGTLYEPTRIRRKAKADAYAMELKALSIENVRKIAGESALMLMEGSGEDSSVQIEKLNLYERAVSRKVFEVVKEQDNIDGVVSKSIPLLGSTVSSEPLDDDWRTRFFSHIKEISKEDMQMLWAKILADEVSRPGRYSLRTLDVLRNLSTNEADAFRRLAEVSTLNGYILAAIWTEKEDRLLFSGIKFPKDRSALISKLTKVDYGQLLELQDIGLIQNICELNHEWKGAELHEEVNAGEKFFYTGFKFDTSFLQIRSKSRPSKIYSTGIWFTKIGTELRGLVQNSGLKEMKNHLIEQLKEENENLELILHENIDWNEKK